MAFAIYNGFNKKENCIHFVKDTVEEEKKRALELADEIKAEKDAVEKQQENIKTTVETVNDLFVSLYDSVDDMVNGNESNETECSAVSEEIGNVSEFCEKLTGRMQEIDMLLEFMASLFISSATTAKPLPASPARAASILAFNARRLVCAAMETTS